MQIALVVTTTILLLGIAIYGTFLQNFAVWKFVIFFVPFFCYSFLLLLASKDRLRFHLLSIILFLPFIGLKVPPGSLDLTVFDILMVPTFFLFLVERNASRGEIKLFPMHYVWLPLILITPSLITTISFANTFSACVTFSEFYLVYVLLGHYMKDDKFLERMHINLAIALIVVCLFVFLEKITGVNFNFGAAHIGQYMHVDNYVVHRTAGIFQDPQKAAQFIAVFMTYMIVLNCRKAFNRPLYKVLSFVAISLAVPSLFITVSRAAIFSGVAVSLVFVTLANKATFATKFFLGSALCLILLFGWLIGGEDVLLSKVLPVSSIKRMEKSSSDLEGRRKVWKDSWRVFEFSPLTGIGPGNYREFLMQERPSLRQFYERGGYVPTMPENGYLKIFYEVGIIGSVGVLYFFICTMCALFRNIFGQQDAISVASIASLLVFLATFLTIFTIADMRNAMILGVLFAVAFVGRAKRSATIDVI